MRDAVASEQGANWTANPVREGWIGSKPTKADIGQVHALAIDLDAKKTSAAVNSSEWLKHWEAERDHARGLGERAAKLPEDVRPAAIVFTGNGLQLFYRLAQPSDANDATAVAAIEQAWRDEVLRPVGSDAVQSVEHLFRLPGLNVKPHRPDGRAELLYASAAHTIGQGDFTQVREALLELDGWRPPSPGKRARGRPPKAPGGATDASPDEGRGKALEARLRPLLARLRGTTRATLSEAAQDLLFMSRTLPQRMNGDASGMDHVSGSDFLMAVAGASKVEGGDMETFAELAYACPDARAHLDGLANDALEARALARAWLRAAPDAGQGGGIGFSEDGVARALADRFEGQFLFDHTTNCWLAWQTDHWAGDETGGVIEACRTLAHEAATAGGAKKPPRVSRNFVMGALGLARSDPRLAAKHDQFDREPYLLGAPGVTVDLRNGQMRAPDPKDYITKRAAVSPSSDAACPRWGAFLDEATGADPELMRYLQVLAGYCLTGDTRTQMLAFIYGPGGTGKSTFVNPIQHILGDYGRSAAVETFLASKAGFDRHPEELARLAGARMVVTSETQQGRAWDAPKIKRMTGGDKITARHMRQNSFEFQPQFKLVISGNAAPHVSADDDGMRRRMHVVPFERKPENPDPELELTLRGEAPGILRWMIEGALIYQREGLNPPPAVTGTTAQIFMENDVLGRWLAEACISEPGTTALWTPACDLYASFLGEVTDDMCPGLCQMVAHCRWKPNQTGRINLPFAKRYVRRVSTLASANRAVFMRRSKPMGSHHAVA